MSLNTPEHILGIELVNLGNNLFSCKSVLLSKKRNSVIIEAKTNATGTLGELIDSVPKQYPVAIALSGSGIIHKNHLVREQVDPDQLFSMIFPSVERKEFYIQQFKSHENALTSIIRKTLLDDLLSKLKGAGLQILMLSLGGIITEQIWGQLNIYGSEIKFDGHFFIISEAKNFVSYQYDPAVKASFPIKIDQEPIPEENIVAYASAFQLMLHEKIQPIVADVDEVNDGLINFYENLKLKKRLLILTFSLFFLLLVSFLTFFHYNQENAKLSSQLGSITANTNQLEAMKDNIAANKALLKELGWNGGYNYGFLVNEIGESLPKQLMLKAILTNDFKTEVEKIPSLPTIKIIGTGSNLTAVNNWIFVLKEKTWIKSVRLEKYKEENDSDQYEFSLLITY